MLDKSCIVKRNKDLVCRTIDEDIFIVHLKTGAYYSLGSIGRFIWEQVDGNSLSIANIIKFVQEKFGDIGKDNIPSDIQTFINDLYAENLICLIKAPVINDARVSFLPAPKNRINKCGKAKSNYAAPELVKYKNAAQKRDNHRVAYAANISPCATSWCV